MKRLFFVLMMTVLMSSCVSSYGYNSTVEHQDGFQIEYSYEYYYNGMYCPVVYVSNVPYFYYRNVWYIVPTYRYTYIYHRPRPVYRYFYSRPHHKYNHNHHYHPNNRPQHKHNNGNVNQRPHKPQHKPVINQNNRQHRPNGNIQHRSQGRPSNHNNNTHRGGHQSRNNRR